MIDSSIILLWNIIASKLKHWCCSQNPSKSPNNRVINGPREKWGCQLMVYPYATISSLRISKRMAMRSERVYRVNDIETEPNFRIPFNSPSRYEMPTA